MQQCTQLTAINLVSLSPEAFPKAPDKLSVSGPSAHNLTGGRQTHDPVLGKQNFSSDVTEEPKFRKNHETEP